MRTPRVTDFDPKAAPVLRSPLDDMPVIERPTVGTKQPPTPSIAPQESRELPTAAIDSAPPFAAIPKPDGRAVSNAGSGPGKNTPTAPPPVRTSVRPYGSPPVRRTITRYAFEFFQDQIETLRQFSLDEKLRGEKGSMSEMIREAVDSYISRRRNSEDA